MTMLLGPSKAVLAGEIALPDDDEDLPPDPDATMDEDTDGDDETATAATSTNGAGAEDHGDDDERAKPVERQRKAERPLGSAEQLAD
jgi:hypothetical protein